MNDRSATIEYEPELNAIAIHLPGGTTRIPEEHAEEVHELLGEYLDG